MAQEVRVALQVAQRFANYYETSRARLWYPRVSLAWLGVSPGPFISDDPNAQSALLTTAGEGDMTAPAADDNTPHQPEATYHHSTAQSIPPDRLALNAPDLFEVDQRRSREIGRAGIYL